MLYNIEISAKLPFMVKIKQIAETNSECILKRNIENMIFFIFSHPLWFN
jgi:hypothetical protein